MVLVRPVTLNFTKPIVFLLNLYIALTYGLLHIQFESFPVAFVEIYGFNLGQEGLAFLSNHDRQPRHYPSLLRPSAPCLREAVQQERRAKARETPPARHGRRLLHPSLPVLVRLERTAQYPLGSGYFSVAAFLLFNFVLSYLSDAYPDYAASVFAGNDFMRSSFGAGFPLFASAMYKHLDVNWASSTLAFLGIAFIFRMCCIFMLSACVR